MEVRCRYYVVDASGSGEAVRVVGVALEDRALFSVWFA